MAGKGAREFIGMSTEDRQSSDRGPGVDRKSSGEAQERPTDFKLDLKGQSLTIDWADGQRSGIDLALLRKHCPCATCRTERDGEDKNPLRVLKADPVGVRVIDARLVGHYAIQFDWSDGHNTGIFNFKLLRKLSLGP